MLRLAFWYSTELQDGTELRRGPFPSWAFSVLATFGFQGSLVAKKDDFLSCKN